MSNWYSKISKNIEMLPDCIDYYESELSIARSELSMKGNRLEVVSSMMPGVVECRFAQLQEIEAILEFLNVQLRKTRSVTFKLYLETYNKALTSRDAEKYADGNVDVVNMTLLVNEFALVRNKFLAIMKGLDQKSWMISNVVKLRCAGLDDARLD